ncbi:MAG: low molecular weight protein-tyrosine-phosphatase [Bacteroidia bacterium]
MRILMVCLGNICRSPLAEGIMQHHLQVNGIQGQVDSAGVLSFHQGEPPQPGSIRVANKHGIDISHQRSRPLVAQDFDDFDWIFTMDESVHEHIRGKAQSEMQLGKIHLFMTYANAINDPNVLDPYQMGDDAFEHVYQVLNKACMDVIKKMKSVA